MLRLLPLLIRVLGTQPCNASCPICECFSHSTLFWICRYVSEYYMKQYATPRPVFLLCVQAVMACAHLLFASSGMPVHGWKRILYALVNSCQTYRPLNLSLLYVTFVFFVMFGLNGWDLWSVPTMLYLASILVGLAHGAHWTLMVATSSELFGLKNFGALYNTLRFETFYYLLVRVICRSWLDLYSSAEHVFYKLDTDWRFL